MPNSKPSPDLSSHDLSPWSHNHHYAFGHEGESERKTTVVVAITAIMMVAEITAGTLFNSMALLADGWHMATHTLALGVGAFAYRYARVNANNPTFSFGTGKVHALASFTSAMFLGMVAVFVLADSVWTIIHPKPIVFNQALMVAVLGFFVNMISVRLLHIDHGHHNHDHNGHAHHDHHDHDDHDDHDDHKHDDKHGKKSGHEHDHNLKAAYAHVVVDAMTSVFAIVALLAGKYMGWTFVDPIVGILGAVIIGQWAYGLMGVSTNILLDRRAPEEIVEKIREKIESDGDSMISDLHLWQIAPGRVAAIISVVSHLPRGVEEYKERLSSLDLSHITIELNRCTMH